MHISHGVRARFLTCGLTLVLALGSAPVVAPAAPVVGAQEIAANAVAYKALQLPGVSGLTMRQRTRARADQPASGAEDAVVVSFQPGKGSQALKKVRECGGKLKRHAKTGGFFVAYVPEGRSAAEFAASLEDIEGVRHAEPDSVVRAALVPNDPSYPSQWGLPKIGAPAAWDVTTGSASVTIAIVDTGVMLTHADLVGRLDTTNDWDFVSDDSIANDDQGHGTHCAGIAAASTDNANQVAGVAGASTILPVKVLDSKGEGLDSDAADGIKWAADHGADVISLSLEANAYSAVIEDAVQYAVAKDCVVVAAAGNSGSPYGVSYPARLPNVLAVGSITTADARSSFSNYGPGLDLCAPGELILSTTRDGGVGMMSGTSMATPHVAGVAALVRSQNPAWTRSQVEQRLTSTTLDLGASGFDLEFGFGLVRADTAVGSTTPPPPPPDPDDSIPGVELPMSPVTGNVDSYTDAYDVYRVALSSGQTLSVALTSVSVDDIDLHLYGPDATSLADDPVASSAGPDSTEEIMHPVARSGVYYIAVRAYSGSGGYTLAYSVGGSAQPDDEIPGVVAPESPIAGSLTEPADLHDVYRLSLTEGQRLSVSLTGPVGTDFDVRLFAPGAASIWVDEPAAQATGISYPEMLTYVVPATGVYFLDVGAWSGSGNYTLTYSALTPPPPEEDDDIPGVPIGPSPRGGTADQALDPVDVYSISLEGGKRLAVDLDGPAGTDFDVYVFGPEAESVYSAPLAWGAGATYPERVRYQVPSSGGGMYYVAVRAYSGTGAYDLSYRVEDTVEVELLADGFEAWPGLWEPWSPSGVTWGQTSNRPSTGSYSAYCAGSGIAAPGPYPSNMEAWLTAGPFDLSAYDGATLMFDMWLNSEADVDMLSAGASTDDELYQTMVWSGVSDGWTTVTLDLADLAGDGTLNYTGQPEVWIGFVFVSNASFSYEGAYIDNVRLTGTRVDLPNEVPVLASIGNRSVDELSLLSFAATATDADGDALTYSLAPGAPDGAFISPSGLFTWTPTEAQGPGNYPVTVNVDDGRGGSDSETLTVSVNEVNVAPVLAPIGAKTVNELELLRFTVMATDADLPANTLTYSLVGNIPAGAAIDPGTGEFTWTPTEAQGPHVYAVSFAVEDGEGGTDGATITVTVNEAAAPNAAPVLASIGPQSVNELVQLAFTASATDPDGDALTFSLGAGAPTGAAITAGGAFTWTPTEAQGPSAPTVRIVVSDGRGGSDYEDVVVTVAEVNAAPVLAPIGNKSATVGVPLTFTATATDADLPANTKTFTLDAGPAGASISAGGAFSWTPAAAGSYPVTVVVSDGALTDFETFTITVAAAPAGVTTVEVAGANRYATAIAASKKAFPEGSEYVVVATGMNWPDALGGSALAGALDAPILLTATSSLPAEVRAEIVRLGATKAIVLGGTPAVSAAVFSQIDAISGVGVERISGPNRYDTANAVAARTIAVLGGGYDGTAFIATGANFPDALGASPLAAAAGWPIYLANPNQGNNAGLVAVMKAAGVTDAILLGGANVVSDAIKTPLGTTYETRLAGANRYDTAVKVAEYGVTHAGLVWDKVALATGENFPDALAGGVLQGADGSVLLLTPTNSLNAGVGAKLAANKASIFEVRFLGSTAAVSQTVRTAVWNILRK